MSESCVGCFNKWDDFRAKLDAEKIRAELFRLLKKCPVITSQRPQVIISDLHLGSGEKDWDLSLPSQSNLGIILDHYMESDYELCLNGDIFELWSFRPGQVFTPHLDVITKLGKYHAQKRLRYIYGNHDGIFARSENVTKYLNPYLPGITVHEGFELKLGNQRVLITHGANGTYDPYSWVWRCSEFFYRWIHAPMLRIFKQHPSYQTPAHNYKIHLNLEGIFNEWAKENSVIMIAGHTHRPVFGSFNTYFNSGCGVNSDGGITFLELDPKLNSATIRLMKASNGGIQVIPPT